MSIIFVQNKINFAATYFSLTNIHTYANPLPQST